MPPTDADLLSAIRSGDEMACRSATEELFDRHHQAALRFAVRLAGESLAPDLVVECFLKVFAVVHRGQGPAYSFRPYLLSAVRKAYVDHLRRSRHEIVVGDIAAVAAAHRSRTTADSPAEDADSELVLRAFLRLPRRWRVVLWRSAVEGEPLEEIGHAVGTNANAVAALNFRAREGLRREYLSMHLASVDAPECRPAVEVLPAFVRGSLSRHRAEGLASHVAGCDACRAALRNLENVNAHLGAALAPPRSRTTSRDG